MKIISGKPIEIQRIDASHASNLDITHIRVRVHDGENARVNVSLCQNADLSACVIVPTATRQRSKEEPRDTEGSLISIAGALSANGISSRNKELSHTYFTF